MSRSSRSISQRANGDIEHLGGIFVGHVFQPDQQQRGTLTFRQLLDGTVEIAELQGAFLSGGLAQLRRDILDRHGQTFAARLAQIVDMLVVENGEQPGPQVRAGLPEVALRQCQKKAILNEIVRPRGVARKYPRIPAQTRYLGFEKISELVHRILLPLFFCTGEELTDRT
jgi:hypothetical protein